MIKRRIRFSFAQASSPHPPSADSPPVASRRRWLGLGVSSLALTLSGCDLFHGSLDDTQTLTTSTTASTTPAGDPAATVPSASPGSPSAGTPSTGTPSPAPASTWAPRPSFQLGSPQPFDLATTLPADIRRGGIFSIDSSGAPLPAGMSLTSNGLLYAGTASVGTTVGVVFAYAEPA